MRENFYPASHFRIGYDLTRARDAPEFDKHYSLCHNPSHNSKAQMR